MDLLREAYRRLQNADSASWRLEGGWRDDCDEHSFGRTDYAIGSFYESGADVSRFIGGSDRIYHFGDEDWSREGGEWVKDHPDLWDNTDWWPSSGEIHVLLVSAFYFASDRDIRVVASGGGETTLRFTLDNSIIPRGDWYRSVTLRGQVTIDERTSVITAYEMEWRYDVVDNDSCDRYGVRATNGEYRVRIDVPDDVYFGTTDDVRDAIDAINGAR